MDRKFEDELLLSIEVNGLDCCFLEEAESIKLMNKILEKFDLDSTKFFMWENDRIILLSSYEDKWESRWDLLMNSISELVNTLFLVITEDATFPLPILEINKVDLVGLLDDSRIFEYFVTDSNLSFIVFDTHHSEFLKLLPRAISI